jgi:hypothetical protein
MTEKTRSGNANSGSSQPPPRRGETPLEEDGREPDDTDGPCELGVVELDPARTVRAEQHPEREKGDQRRNAHPRGTERDESAPGENRADHEQHRSDVHLRIFTGRRLGAPPSRVD